MEKGARERFLSGAMAAMGESTGLIEVVAKVLGDTIEELDERNQGLAEKLRKANEEAAGLREVRRSAEELRDAHREWMQRVIVPSPLVPHMNNLFAALADGQSIEDQDLQRDLVWALERLAESSPEHMERIKIIAGRFCLPVMLPVFEPEDDEEGEIDYVAVEIGDATAEGLLELLRELGLNVLEPELEGDEEEPELTEANREEFRRMADDDELVAEMKRDAVNELARRVDALFRSSEGAEPGKPL